PSNLPCPCGSRRARARARRRFRLAAVSPLGRSWEPMTRAWSQPGFEAVARFIRTRTGLVFAPRRCDDAEAVIRRAMERADVRDAHHYLARLEAGELALDDIVDELTVGETYFFRDSAHF